MFLPSFVVWHNVARIGNNANGGGESWVSKSREYEVEQSDLSANVWEALREVWWIVPSYRDRECHCLHLAIYLDIVPMQQRRTFVTLRNVTVWSSLRYIPTLHSSLCSRQSNIVIAHELGNHHPKKWAKVWSENMRNDGVLPGVISQT